ncbi:restriction endonuclease subunit S [Bariatricus massiliensis]|uniref:Restriction endonuclease subunit S n=1 Tax=Bariatricus massiliensis TaxID=1745713 RepID=A0ABS8DJP0_9FIRM|nr:restriction endonuclease subunit S [Bariatricus massiliensis]NSE33976.1 restriction endonuclease subunit S [Faecalicatena fissicatena]MCB7305503.1 restriction endonuclease subunit S [Bariatricus massiliensis]MCB7388648.1 restriction endonuclease subunit S [Bariatricus massiliensis]MCB7412821.1 restriction endonuclease subunit S [Bariatricus massiliensis]MCQ5254873.1 restriction endonuclease subunit S [Bariatricus massiliensis]
MKTVNFRNKDNVYGIDDLMGVSLTKEFIKSPANTISLDVSNYKIVKPFQFACNLMHVGRDKKVAVGMLTDADNVIISPAFTVFEIINNNVILPEVLVSWFSQSFFDNEVSYLASEGIRDGIKWDTFAQIPIFIPEFEIQTKIQNIYKNIQQNKLEISTLNNFADTFITTLSSR